MLILRQNLDADTVQEVTFHLRSLVSELAPRCACSEDLEAALDQFATMGAVTPWGIVSLLRKGPVAQ